MREIKLKQPVWENGKFLKWHYWGFKDGLYQHPENQHESYQFTGLLDKNGKEIYEGDILRFHQLVLFSRKEGKKYETTEAEVVWYEGYGLSGFTLKVTGKHHLHSLDATKGEIIGNIYEKSIEFAVK